MRLGRLPSGYRMLGCGEPSKFREKNGAKKKPPGLLLTLLPPLPVPLAGDSVSQLLSLVAVHAQPVPAVTEKVPVDPFAPTEMLVGASRYVQDEVVPAWVTLTV